MNNYSPSVELYYCKYYDTLPDSGNRLVPAPKLSISPEYYYANDVIIGYTYNITLDGYATSLDRTASVTGELGLKDTVKSIQHIQNIFNNNGGYLVAQHSGTKLFDASGINVKSINFEQSDNNWVNYVPYTIQLEANEIRLGDCSGIYQPTIACTGIPSGVINSTNLIDMQKYRVRSFDDSWSFDVGDTIYNSFESGNGDFHNEYFNISYTISSVGKHYFVGDKLIPAWNQAKNFCQHRLYTQVSGLLNKLTLPISVTGEGCSTLSSLSNIFESNGDNIFYDSTTASGLKNSDYNIFNEKITCNTSESDGSFSLTYNAIIKNISGVNTYNDPYTIHTFSTTKEVQDDGKSKNITVSIDGTIQGLVKGGLLSYNSVNNSGLLQLPDNGQIFLSYPIPSGASAPDKYSHALLTYNKIVNTGVVQKTFNSDFAQLLGISNKLVGVSGDCVTDTGVPPQSSFTSTHNYSDGVITYKVSYDTAKACAKSDGSYQSVSISFSDSVPTIQEFVVPGRSGGPIIQDILVNQPRKITLTVDGYMPNNACCSGTADLLEIACSQIPTFSGIPNGTSISNTILQQNRFSQSSDGSYSLTRAYIYYDA